MIRQARNTARSAAGFPELCLPGHYTQPDHFLPPIKVALFITDGSKEKRKQKQLNPPHWAKCLSYLLPSLVPYAGEIHLP